jgi:predicted amidophosphoribosyltransferase
MKCSNCKNDNRQDAKFCTECGKPLSDIVECPKCKNANPKGSKFCDKCANPLTVKIKVGSKTITMDRRKLMIGAVCLFL